MANEEQSMQPSHGGMAVARSRSTTAEVLAAIWQRRNRAQFPDAMLR